ncbi:ABC transporter substrate-binding protein [Nitratidesulfovibrio sp. 1201_IL3209]|uniref:ABC transporter substrate-binding protein n=1 Tax=Nitratidesulfovibrio sp. 1201_IL3209 TaxID=3084053 RepID=UPI002FD98125
MTTRTAASRAAARHPAPAGMPGGDCRNAPVLVPVLAPVPAPAPVPARRRPAWRRLPVLPSLLCLLALCALLAACDTDSPRQPEDAAAPGVTDEAIHLASSLALTGHASYLGVQTLRGALSYINHVNDAGGVHGRRITLTAADDGYDPPRCLANTQRFLIDGDVFALFSYVGTPTTMRVLPLVEEARIPLVGMFTGANGLREPFNRYVFNVRASYYQETAAAVRHLVRDLGLTRIAVFYQYDAYGFDGLTGTEIALRELGLAPVARGSYVRGTTKVEEGLRRILAADAQAVVMVGTYEPSARFIRLAEQAGLHAVFHCLSFTGAEELARLLGDSPVNPVTMSQVVPPPRAKETPDLLAAAADYVQLLHRYFPDETPNTIGLEGYVNARILVEGLRRAGRDLTRESFVQALESLRDYPLGGSTYVSFSPESRQGMNQVYFTRLYDEQFELIRDFREVRPLPAPAPAPVPVPTPAPGKAAATLSSAHSAPPAHPDAEARP